MVKVIKADYTAAANVELPVAHFRVLKFASKAKGAVGYQDMKKATGYYSTLTKVCRAGNEGSLVELGLMKETPKETKSGGTKIAFTITAKGLKTVKKATAKPSKKAAK